MLNLFFLIISLAIIIVAANFLVDGASSLAKRLGLRDMVIGLTVVAFGTSAPELTVNVFSAIKGSTDIAFGNIIGSNLCNILLILGLSAVIRPIPVAKSMRNNDIPFSLLAALMVFILGNDVLIDHSTMGNVLTQSDALTLLAFFIIFLTYTFKSAQQTPVDENINALPMWKTLLWISIGLGGLFFGGKILVDNAVELARLIGITEKVIGLTIIAVGTSLPELATSAVAAYKKKADIAIGNVVGSNIFNIFFVMGITPLIRNVPLGTSANFDLYAVLFATVLLFVTAPLIGKKKWAISTGILFLLLYALYVTILIIK